MEENTAPVKFIKVAKESVLSFLEEAKQRVVIAKPGYFLAEVEKLLSLAKQQQVRCDVYVDTDEKSIRYGFGEEAALKLLNENLSPLHVRSANYIRMAIVIIDHAVMVYSPVALSWEEVPEQVDFPNGFLGGKALADSLLRQIEGELFFKSQFGAYIGDMFMSLIHTCSLMKANPFDYLIALQKYSSDVFKNPSQWMPWNFQATIASMTV
jgi:hypothetical protein